jgi:hypothetical protein
MSPALGDTSLTFISALPCTPCRARLYIYIRMDFDKRVFRVASVPTTRAHVRTYVRLPTLAMIPIVVLPILF